MLIEATNNLKCFFKPRIARMNTNAWRDNSLRMDSCYSCLLVAKTYSLLMTTYFFILSHEFHKGTLMPGGIIHSEWIRAIRVH